MGRIRILDEHIANQIAAGEVVERPASVVKELVENAVDAGATRIDVTVEEGGLKSIRVTDNGSGMDGEDCRLAFQRHATSKIAEGKDLFRIRSLGFRGEALPSIAAVARVVLTTADGSGGLGHRVEIEGGDIAGFGEVPADRGTDIAVKDLFYNTPARLKYMKTVQTELSHISDYVYRLAFAYPEIAFSLRHNGKLLLQTPGRGDLRQVIASVYGPATARQMIEVRAESADFRLHGFIGKPEISRANRYGITLIVNGRYVRSFPLAAAIQQAYHTLLPVHRYPLAVLRLAMDPSLVDVNVHPAKLEVRFSKEADLLRFTEDELRRALLGQTLIPAQRKAVVKERVVQEKMPLYAADTSGAAEAERREGPQAPGPQGSMPGTRPAAAVHGRSAEPEHAENASGIAPAGGEEVRTAEVGKPENPLYAERPAGTPPTVRERLPQSRQHGSAAHASGTPRGGASGRERSAPAAERVIGPELAGRALEGLGPPPDPPAGEAPVFPELHPIGQLHGTYIVAQNDDGLYLIDQHAAHERIQYEKYYDLFGNPTEASQPLLVPFTLEFTPSEAEILKQRLPLFAAAGVEIEPFGGRTFLVRSCPHWLPSGEEQRIIGEMAEWILSEKGPVDIAKLREKSAILCSCKSSVRANESLTMPEMRALIGRLSRCKSPFTCPHGRPVVISFSKYELEKMFKRVM